MVAEPRVVLPGMCSTKPTSRQRASFHSTMKQNLEYRMGLGERLFHSWRITMATRTGGLFASYRGGCGWMCRFCVGGRILACAMELYISSDTAPIGAIINRRHVDEPDAMRPDVQPSRNLSCQVNGACVKIYRALMETRGMHSGLLTMVGVRGNGMPRKLL